MPGKTSAKKAAPAPASRKKSEKLTHEDLLKWFACVSKSAARPHKSKREKATDKVPHEYRKVSALAISECNPSRNDTPLMNPVDAANAEKAKEFCKRHSANTCHYIKPFFQDHICAKFLGKAIFSLIVTFFSLLVNSPF